MSIDKNQAIIDFLITCPELSSNPLFFNYVNAKEDSTQIITQSNDKSMNKTFVDGSVLRRYTFTFIYFKSISYTPVVKQPGYSNENVEEMLDVQAVVDWVTEQAEIFNYPNFGPNCFIEEMKVLTDNPNLNSIDTTSTPPLAKYSLTIQIDYIDTSKMLWQK